MHDSQTDLLYQYTYDSLGRLMTSAVINAEDSYDLQRLLSTRQTYDADNQLSAQYWQTGDTNYSETYTYSKTTGLLATHKPAVGNTLSFTYDALQRLSTVTGGIYGKTYTYRDISGTDKTTTQVASLTYDLPTDITYGYTYDVLGNIATYTEAGTTYTYTYDAQNQLTSVKTNGAVTHTYEYDAAGNIKKATNATGTHTYTYETGVWKDLLKSFDGGEITYDNAGNPTSYYNGTEWNMTWAEGRRLVSASGDGKSLTFTYDSDGLRLTKKVGNTTYQYYYAGGKLMRQTGGGNTLDFFYDTSGNPYALKYNNTLYYYITNLQGDVLHIVNTSGTPVVSYSYSPYGEPNTVKPATTNDALAAANPLRYRGYVYDTETELYYLQSRYYDPTTCRFINADGCVSNGYGIIGYNMFAYCANSPVGSRDTSGYAIEIVLDVGSAILSLIALIRDPSWANLGLLVWDGVSVLIAFLPGSYVLKAGKLAVNVADAIDDFADGSKFLKGSYKQLKKLFNHLKNIEVHHVVEKRFAALFSSGIDDFLSVPLAKEFHKLITKRWRDLYKISDDFALFKLGSDYTQITYSMMEKAINEVYKDMPELLEAALEWFRKEWIGLP